MEDHIIHALLSQCDALQCASHEVRSLRDMFRLYLEHQLPEESREQRKAFQRDQRIAQQHAPPVMVGHPGGGSGMPNVHLRGPAEQQHQGYNNPYGIEVNANGEAIAGMQQVGSNTVHIRPPPGGVPQAAPQAAYYPPEHAGQPAQPMSPAFLQPVPTAPAPQTPPLSPPTTVDEFVERYNKGALVSLGRAAGIAGVESMTKKDIAATLLEVRAAVNGASNGE